MGDPVPQWPARRRRVVLALWAAVAVFPLLAGLVMGGVHADADCDIDDDNAFVALLLFDFLVFPTAAAAFGTLAGWITWRPRGRGWAVVGASSAALLSLVWGFVGFWTILITITEAACPSY